MRGQVKSAAVVAVVVGVLGWAAPAWAASSLQISVSSTPEQSVPVQLTFSGYADPNQFGNQDALLSAEVRPAGGLPCQATYNQDVSAAGSVSTEAPEDRDVGSGTFSTSTSFTPDAPGSYLVCAWLWNGGYGSSEATYSSTTTTFSARGPQVPVLSVALGSTPRPGEEFQVNYTTQTDQDLNLYSIIKRAGGLPCQSSFELEQGANENLDDVLDGSSVFGGPSTTKGDDTESQAGSYLICTWVEGPTQGEVDAATSTPIYVGTPPPPAKRAVSPRLRLRHVTASRKHGVTLTGSTGAGVKGSVTVAAACGKSTVTAHAHASSRAFKAHLRLPRGCRRARRVHVSAAWPGSAAFSRQAVSDSVKIGR